MAVEPLGERNRGVEAQQHRTVARRIARAEVEAVGGVEADGDVALEAEAAVEGAQSLVGRNEEKGRIASSTRREAWPRPRCAGSVATA